MSYIIQQIYYCHEKSTSMFSAFPLKEYEERIGIIDEITANTNIWENHNKASALMKERQKLSDLISKVNYMKDSTSTLMEFAALMPDEIDDLKDQVLDLVKKIEEFELNLRFSDPLDKNSAILTINSGAGGLESANWVTMLLRMYYRYAESSKFKVELLDKHPSEEHSAICTDSVSIRIDGEYAYGFFKNEAGVHRLIRNSPFNSGDARHTSFAAVSVMPDIEDSIDIKIEDKDIEISAQTAGGPGGQHQNKVSSAIRLKHLPTGINILVRTERDQSANKKTAFKMLKAKLYDLEMKKRNAEKEKMLSLISDVSFGHQIRTVTLSPYSLVKDHRSGLEINNAESVLDGDLQSLILSNLKLK